MDVKEAELSARISWEAPDEGGQELLDTARPVLQELNTATRDDMDYLSGSEV